MLVSSYFVDSESNNRRGSITGDISIKKIKLMMELNENIHD